MTKARLAIYLGCKAKNLSHFKKSAVTSSWPSSKFQGIIEIALYSVFNIIAL